MRVKNMFKGFIAGNISLASPYWLQDAGGDIYLACLNLKSLANTRHLRLRLFLKRSQRFSREKLEQYQAGKLKQLLVHAYKNVPYYTEIFKRNNLSPYGFNSVKDLKKLPVLTKDDVIKNLDRLVSRGINKKYLERAVTSGSTGKPLEFYRDKRDEYVRRAFFLRALEAFNVKARSRSVLIWMLPFISERQNEHYVYDPHLKRLSLAAYSSGSDFCEEKIGLIRKFRPDYILASPGVIYRLADYARENNIGDLNVRSFICCFDNLHPFQREFISLQFHGGIYSYYGSEERVITAFECSSHNGMHIDAERGIAEVLDEDGESAREGQTGRIVATGLYNFAMPFIRYETGDIGSISSKACSCGRTLPRLESLDGRTSEVIKYKGKFICAGGLSAVMSKFQDLIKECQFIQEKEDTLILNIVKKRNFMEPDKKEIIRYLRRLIDEELNISFNFVDAVPRTRMDKFPLIVSKLQN